MIKMVSMKGLTPSMKEMSTPDMPEYPYGTCIELDDKAIKALGLSSMNETGEEVGIQAIGEITSVSDHNGKKRMSIQITKMGIVSGESPADKAEDAGEGKEPAETQNITRQIAGKGSMMTRMRRSKS